MNTAILVVAVALIVSCRDVDDAQKADPPPVMEREEDDHENKVSMQGAWILEVPESWRNQRDRLVGQESFEIPISEAVPSGHNTAFVSVTTDSPWERKLDLKSDDEIRTYLKEQFGEYPASEASFFRWEKIGKARGYDENRRAEITPVRYIGPDELVRCFGLRPGHIRCFFGSSHLRFHMTFHSDAEDWMFKHLEELRASGFLQKMAEVRPGD